MERKNSCVLESENPASPGELGANSARTRRDHARTHANPANPCEPGEPGELRANSARELGANVAEQAECGFSPQSS